MQHVTKYLMAGLEYIIFPFLTLEHAAPGMQHVTKHLMAALNDGIFSFIALENAACHKIPYGSAKRWHFPIYNTRKWSMSQNTLWEIPDIFMGHFSNLCIYYPLNVTDIHKIWSKLIHNF